MKKPPFYYIAPSILSADMARLGSEVDDVVAAGADLIHVDVMDNHYVPNLTIGSMVVKSLNDYGVPIPLDVHLMIKPVLPSISAFAKAGATYLSFHAEAEPDVGRVLHAIRHAGCKPGLVFSPDIALTGLEQWLQDIDLVLIMSVHPGFSGQSFMPEALDKAKRARQLIDTVDRDIRLEIDGGINADNIALAATVGCDTFVAGSAIFDSPDRAGAICKLRSALATCE